jgi:hypothetical protein
MLEMRICIVSKKDCTWVMRLYQITWCYIPEDSTPYDHHLRIVQTAVANQTEN